MSTIMSPTRGESYNNS